jgi:hypothetical protein
MSVENPQDEPSLLATVDFRAFFETMRLRWWIIPAVIAVAMGLLVAQESRMRTEPQSYRVSKSYQVPNPKAVLGSVGVNPGLIEEFPDSISQLLILASGETQRSIAAEIGSDVVVNTPISYEIPFVFTCQNPAREDCLRAIDAYATKASEIRKEAILAGLQVLRKTLAGVQSVNDDRVTAARIAGIDALIENLNTDLVLIDTFSEEVGSTIRDVGRIRYVFGFAAGLVIALLILLQLTFSDRRIRSTRQLVRLIGNSVFLGAVSESPDAVGDRRAALALYRALRAAAAHRIRYIPLRASVGENHPVGRLSRMLDSHYLVTKPFSELSVSDLALATTDEVDVLIVQRNRDLRKDVLDGLVASLQSGRNFGGVILIN